MYIFRYFEPTIIKSFKSKIGLRISWLPSWQTTLALFQLNLDSELLFIGDGGNIEPSRPSKRVGVEWTNPYRPTDW